MQFERSWILYLIPAYLLIEAGLFFFFRKQYFNLPTASSVQPPVTWRIIAAKAARIFAILSAIFIVLALAGPQQTEQTEKILPSGIDIMIALDVSGSMAAEDFAPHNRLYVAKDVLYDFIRARPSDRIGLILFSGRSITRSPLTLQHGPLLKYVKSIQMGILPDGTAIGTAMMSGVNRLRVESGADAKKEKKGDRILLLITDGRNNAGEIHPMDALRYATDEKIKIYTIGVGGLGEVPFPYTAPDGKKLYRKERADLDETLLQRIAESTGGRYFRATDPQSLHYLFQTINTLEKSEARKERIYSSISLSPRFSRPGVVLLAIFALAALLIRQYP